VDRRDLNPDEQFAEWYVWAKREVSTDNRVCLGAAQAGIIALENGADQEAARMAARRSVAGHGVGLVGDIAPRRRAYAEWYDWARREIGGGAERQHVATRAALAALDRGADSREAVTVARRELDLPPAPPQEPVEAPQAAIPSPPSVTAPPATPSPMAAPAPPHAAAPSAAYTPTLPYVVSGPVPPAAARHVYAGVWRRVAASLIDAFVLGLGLVVLALVVSFFVILGLISSGQQPTDENLSAVSLALYAIAFVLMWLYFAGLESSPWQGTIGKRMTGILVTDLYGNRISFGRATGRFFVKVTPVFIIVLAVVLAAATQLVALLIAVAVVLLIALLLLGLVVALTQRKQGMHDLMARTIVVMRQYVSQLNFPQQHVQQSPPGGAREAQRT
jgi:uncharacterized RDD family membrane protein YckC